MWGNSHTHLRTSRRAWRFFSLSSQWERQEKGMLPERLSTLNNNQKAHLLNVQLGWLDQTGVDLTGHSINLFSCRAASSDLEKAQIINRQSQEPIFLLYVHLARVLHWWLGTLLRFCSESSKWSSKTIQYLLQSLQESQGVTECLGRDHVFLLAPEREGAGGEI